MADGPDAAAWNAAIAGWFFCAAQAGRPVYFAVDQAELGRVGAELGLDAESARDAFIEAMAKECPAPGDPFSYWARLTRKWEQGGAVGPPPFVALLALSTLAANESARPGSYPALYGPVARLLGVDEDAVKRDYEDTVRSWWERLRRWLADQGDAYGIATWEAPQRGYYSIVGHAWSQVLVRAPDRSDFTEFFSTLGVHDGSEVDLDQDTAPEELFARWKAWARLTGHVSARLEHVLDERHRSDDVLTALISRILADELAHWDGVVRDPQRVPIIQLVLTANTFDRHVLEFSAITPEVLANRTIAIFGETVELGAAGDIVPVSIPVSATALEVGLSAEGPVPARYSARSIVPLARRDADLWRSVGQLEPGEEAYALVAESALTDFFAVVPEPRESNAVDNVPAGWLLFRDIEPISSTMQTGTDASALVPRTSDLAHLRGGLRLAGARRFLTDGPPDVVMPGIEGVNSTVAIDGEIIATFSAAGGVVRLCEMPLGAGEHEVRAGARRLRLEIVDFDWWDPPSAPVLAHVVAIGSNTDARIDEVRCPRTSDAVVAVGAMVSGPATRPPVFMPPPDRVVLLGRPGEIAVEKASHAPWAAGAGLPLTAFEPLSRFGVSRTRPFVATWAVVTTSGETRIVRLAPALDLRSGGSSNAIETWAAAVLSADGVALLDSGDAPLWRDYVKAARVPR